MLLLLGPGKRGAGISNYGLATSNEGVHWTDTGINMSPWGVNPCNDPKMNKSIPVAGIGSGSCWEDPSQKGKYVTGTLVHTRRASIGCHAAMPAESACVQH